MKPELILQADVLDIIFEERNKEYGAYILRKNYNRRLITGMIGMLLVVVIFISISWVKPEKGNSITDCFIPPDATPTAVALPPPVVQKLPKGPRGATVSYSTPVIAETPDTEVPENETLATETRISTTTEEGPIQETMESPLAGRDTSVSHAEDEPGPHILHKAERMPEFPGGEAAMRRYLQKNLRFDFAEMEPGSRAIIHCRFIVDREGKVSAIEVIKSAGVGSFDREVTRVIGRMPDWKPGYQNGKNVAVYFTLPVIVEVPEE